MPTLFIASPLEAEIAAHLRGLDPRLTVVWEPDLLPTPLFPGDHNGAPLHRTPEQAARWARHLSQADILWGVPGTADYAHCTRLRWVQGTSTGIGPAVARLNAPGLLATTARGVHAGPLAEFVFMALLAHTRRLAHLQAEQRAHRWQRGHFPQIAGQTLVLLGAGDLARGCARIARALDMHVVAITRDPSRARDHASLFHEILPTAALHDALRRADALVVTTPLTPETEGLVDAAALEAAKPGLALVNIGRGRVIDEPALVAALRSGQVGYAALDVTAIEPLPADSPLWDMANVLISPHSASTVAEENWGIAAIFAHNLACWLDGRQDAMRNVLDGTRGY